MNANGLRSDEELNLLMETRDWRDCYVHGWSAIGIVCPKCAGGAAPRKCARHRWSHYNKGCPKCEKEGK